MSEEDAARDIALDAFRDWIDEERLVVNVNSLYRELATGNAATDRNELHGRIMAWRRRVKSRLMPATALTDIPTERFRTFHDLFHRRHA